MGKLHRIIALLLLGVWLPATLHCEVEAAEIALEIAGCTQADAHDHSHNALPENCAVDNCATVEGSFTSTSTTQAAARAPVFCAIHFIALILVPDLAVSPPPSNGVNETHTAPAELSRSWMFSSRAAPLPGAPALS